VFSMKKSEKAGQLFACGYNCAQSVVCAFAEELGLDMDFAAKMASGFGGGMGRMREVCGAVSGAVSVLSFLYGYTEAEDIEGKKELYKKIQDFCSKFKEENGSIVCKELLGVDFDGNPVPDKRNGEYYKKRPCRELVESAARILEEYYGK